MCIVHKVKTRNIIIIFIFIYCRRRKISIAKRARPAVASGGGGGGDVRRHRNRFVFGRALSDFNNFSSDKKARGTHDARTLRRYKRVHDLCVPKKHV